MYDKLVKRLREAPIDMRCAKIMREAADAIEELSRQLAEYHSYDGFLLAHGCFVELPEPPKEKT